MPNLKGQFFGNYQLQDVIEQNIITFLKYGMLEIGGFYNIYLSDNESNLSPVFFSHTGVASNYTIWNAIKHDLVWETGVLPSYNGAGAPLPISGLYYNSNFYPTGSQVAGTGYYVDYSRGRVIFENPLPSGSNVSMQYSVRAVQFYPIDGPEYKHFVLDWFKRTGGSGLLNTAEQAYLPAVFVQIPSYKTIKGVELGSRTKTSKVDLQFDVFATNGDEMKRITDVLYMLETKSFGLFDINHSGYVWPLNERGELRLNAQTWPNLVANFGAGNVRFQEDAKMNRIYKQPLPIFHSRISLGLQVDVNPV